MGWQHANFLSFHQLSDLEAVGWWWWFPLAEPNDTRTAACVGRGAIGARGHIADVSLGVDL